MTLIGSRTKISPLFITEFVLAAPRFIPKKRKESKIIGTI